MSASTGWGARIGLDPLMGDGAIGRLTLLSGTRFEPSTTYTLRVGGQPVIPPTVASDANGAIAPVQVILPALARGPQDVMLASALYTRSFTGAYRVYPNLCISPMTGEGRAGETYTTNAAIPLGGWVGMVTRIEGTGFAANATIAANSITIGGAATVHPAIPVAANGGFGSTTVLVTSNLPFGMKDLVINDGAAQTFAGVYEVRRSIALSPARSNSSAGTTLLIEGWGFAAGSTGAITVGTSATNPASLTVGADGSFSGVVSLQSSLGNGVYAVTFGAPQTDAFANCFQDTGTAGGGTAASLGVYPLTMNGLPNQAVRIEGVGRWTTGTIGANSTVFLTPGPNLPSIHAAVTVAGGVFPKTWVVATGPMELNTNQIQIADPGGNVKCQTILMRRLLSVCPVLVSGQAVFTVTVTGYGFNDNFTVVANTISVGGTATTHPASVVSARGVLGPLALVLPARPNGALDVAVNDGTANIFTGAVHGVRTIGLSYVVGGGAAGDVIRLNGYGFTASSTLPANTVTVGGLGTTHAAIAVAAGGSFAASPLALAALNAGAWDVSAQGVFAQAYRVYDPVVAVRKHQTTPVQPVSRGSTVTYSFSYTNASLIGDPAAVAVVLHDTLPAGTRYVPGSTTNTLGALQEWFHPSCACFNGVETPAADVTRVQWTLAGPLPAGATGTARFQVVLP